MDVFAVLYSLSLPERALLPQRQSSVYSVLCQIVRSKCWNAILKIWMWKPFGVSYKTEGSIFERLLMHFVSETDLLSITVAPLKIVTEFSVLFAVKGTCTWTRLVLETKRMTVLSDHVVFWSNLSSHQYSTIPRVDYLVDSEWNSKILCPSRNNRSRGWEGAREVRSFSGALERPLFPRIKSEILDKVYVSYRCLWRCDDSSV